MVIDPKYNPKPNSKLTLNPKVTQKISISFFLIFFSQKFAATFGSHWLYCNIIILQYSASLCKNVLLAASPESGCAPATGYSDLDFLRLYDFLRLV